MTWAGARATVAVARTQRPGWPVSTRAAFTLLASLLAMEIFQDFRRGFLWCFLSFLLGFLPLGSSPRQGQLWVSPWLTVALAGRSPSLATHPPSPTGRFPGALVWGRNTSLALGKNGSSCMQAPSRG